MDTTKTAITTKTTFLVAGLLSLFSFETIRSFIPLNWQSFANGEIRVNT